MLFGTELSELWELLPGLLCLAVSPGRPDVTVHGSVSLPRPPVGGTDRRLYVMGREASVLLPCHGVLHYLALSGLWHQPHCLA